MPSKKYKERLEKLRGENFFIYTTVQYRWWLLIATFLFLLPNLWVIPLVMAVIGFFKYSEIK